MFFHLAYPTSKTQKVTLTTKRINDVRKRRILDCLLLDISNRYKVNIRHNPSSPVNI